MLPAPSFYLSAFFEATRQEYYARLLAVTARGEWEEWLKYFLSGVEQQALDAVDRIRRIDHLVVSWRGQVSSASSRLPERAIELLLENPFWTVSALAERLGVAFTTAQRAIDRLESGGIVARTSAAKRNRLYCARAVLEILEEPARPVAEEGLRTGRPR